MSILIITPSALIGSGDDIDIAPCAPSTDEGADGNQEADLDDDDDDDEDYDPGEVVVTVIVLVAAIPAAGEVGHVLRERRNTVLDRENGVGWQSVSCWKGGG